MKYVLRLHLRIEPVDRDGRRTGEGLTVEEEMTLGHMGFMEIAGVLGRFHELGEAVKEEREI